jgi:hypothetical protein
VKIRVWILMGTVGLAGCSEPTNPRVVTKLNTDAMLVGELPSNPLQGRVITSWVDQRGATMSTLYGNDAAVQYARTSVESKYPVGAVLSVVTWGQQEDLRWFGGRVPRRARSVEFVRVTGPGTYDYQRYEGSPLTKMASPGLANSDERLNYLLSQRAAVMP